MEIVQVPVEELKPAEYNPRTFTEKEAENLRDSLLNFGMVDPVIVNSNPERYNVIIGGHFRAREWQNLGYETVPVVYLDLTLEQEKELNIRLNKNTGEFDWKLLEEHFDREDLLAYGFDDAEFPIDDAPVFDTGDGEEAAAPELPDNETADTAMVQLFFTEKQKAEFVEFIRIVQSHTGIDNITDAAYYAAQHQAASLEAGSDA